MKQILMKMTLALVLTTASQLTYAQCEQKVMFKASQTNYLDGNGHVERTQEVATMITVSPSEVSIVYGGKEENMMTGKITARTCEWAKPFKDGKMVITATMQHFSGAQQNATLTITAVDGKTSITYVAAERPGKIQLWADEFFEVKE